MDWRDRIVSDSKICHGKVCVKGTRMMVSVILANLAAGISAKEIVNEYPSVQLEDIEACLAYAAELTLDEDMIPLRKATV